MTLSALCLYASVRFGRGIHQPVEMFMALAVAQREVDSGVSHSGQRDRSRSTIDAAPDGPAMRDAGGTRAWRG
jgi:hypothetical protein